MNAHPHRPCSCLVVVSVDGLSTADFEQLQTLPNFGELIRTGSFCRRMRGIYPTQTYPLHATLITGTHPVRHGIQSNTLIQPGRSSPDWHWYRRDIRATPLYDLAIRAGMRSAALLWPTAGGSANRYVVPEIRPTRLGQSFPWLLLSAGRPLFILHMLLRYGRLVQGFSFHYLDELTTAVAAYLLRGRRVQLLLLHLLQLDANRHRHGFQTPQAQRAIEEEDRRLGRLREAARLSGLGERTAFVVFGDHAYIDVHTRVRINAAFRQAGLLELDRRGRLRSWQAWANACEGSAQVVLRDRGNEQLKRRVEAVFEGLRAAPGTVVERVYGRGQLAELGLGGEIDYVLEARAGCYFVPEMEGETVEHSPGTMRAVHGYHPDRPGYSSVFLASGCGLRPGLELPQLNIVQLGPTLAALLGLAMPEAEGRTLTEMLL
jgi:predicted AlkP superfamily pyrophosphatase or phosphodiesterase